MSKLEIDLPVGVHINHYMETLKKEILLYYPYKLPHYNYPNGDVAFEAHHAEVVKWCNENCGSSFIYNYNVVGSSFLFSSEEDATAYKLCWE